MDDVPTAAGGRGSVVRGWDGSGWDGPDLAERAVVGWVVVDPAVDGQVADDSVAAGSAGAVASDSRYPD